jgi:hypothetical protein
MADTTLTPNTTGRVLLKGEQWRISERAWRAIEEIERNNKMAMIKLRDFVLD